MRKINEVNLSSSILVRTANVLTSPSSISTTQDNTDDAMNPSQFSNYRDDCSLQYSLRYENYINVLVS